MKSLVKIEGIGKGISMKIEEYVKTGKIRTYETLKKEIPVNLDELAEIEGIGPKTIIKLYEELGIKNIKELDSAAKQGKIRSIPDFGTKTELNIIRNIQFKRMSTGRKILGLIFDDIEVIKNKLLEKSFVKKISIAGSIRRMKDTVGDADILVVSSEPKKVMEFFTSLDSVQKIIAKGNTKSSVKMNGFNIDLRVVSEESYGAALNYFTGSKEHNVQMRKIAIGKKMKLSEYGLFKDGKQIAGHNEESIYSELGLKYVEPELREGILKFDSFPKLIPYGSLKGDLQIQTDWTDGTCSIDEMAKCAEIFGLEYIAITDHTKSLGMANGLDEKRLLKHMKEVYNVDKKSNIKVLTGAEVNIKKSGDLDINDNMLSKLDVVGASIHSAFRMDRKEMTSRIIKAIENSNVDILFHPTTRRINKREPIDFDMEKIFQVCIDTGTILEINASPDRSDLKGEHVKMALEMGCKFSINSDAHDSSHYKFLKYGIGQARRGWASKKDVINTYNVDKMLKFLK